MSHPTPPPDCRFFARGHGEWYFVYRTPGHGTGIWAEPGCVHHHSLNEISGDIKECARGIAVQYWLKEHAQRHRAFMRLRYAHLPASKHQKHREVLKLKKLAAIAKAEIEAWQSWNLERNEK